MSTTQHTTGTDLQREAWERLATGFDDSVTPGNMDLAADALRLVELQAGERFLDVAAGSGALAIPAARLGADVVAVDFAPTLVERLRGRVTQEGLTNLRAEVMDGCALQFDDDVFDVAGSQHGVSLFPDLAAGMNELVRVTRPGGRVLVVTVGDPRKAEFLSYFIGALRAVVPGFPGLPTDPPPLPFRLAHPVAAAQALTASGLEDVRVRSVAWRQQHASVSEYWDWFTHSNPIGAQLVAGLSAEQSDETRRVLDGMLRERSGGGPAARLESEALVVVGTKPTP